LTTFFLSFSHIFVNYIPMNVKLHSQSGKTLIELLVVLAIAAVVTTYAITRTGSARINLNRQNIARELKISLERARFDSVKRRPSQESEMSYVIVTGATSFTVTLDLNQNGALDASDTRQVNFPDSSVKIVGSDVVFPMTIKFDRHGHTIATNGINASIDAPVFFICENCTADSALNSTNSNLVTISPTGTVAMLNGGQTPATVQNPTVSSVSQSADINSLVTVGNVSGGGSTPSPTPILTPTPTPTPSPNPSATPTPSPTPMPTPGVCLRNQRPAQDNCICKSPMSVRSNGKCQ
jgi:prepilin-type N-terminal cleavage/methylation domain-containing protein